MVGRQDADQLIFKELGIGIRVIGSGTCGDDQIILFGLQFLDGIVGIADLKIDIRELFQKYPHNPGEPFITEYAAGSDLELARVSRDDFGDLQLGIIEDIDDLFRCLKEPVSGCCQDHLPGCPEKNIEPQLAFDVLELLAESGLRKKEPVGSFGHISGPSDCLDHSQMFDFQVVHGI